MRDLMMHTAMSVEIQYHMIGGIANCPESHIKSNTAIANVSQSIDAKSERGGDRNHMIS